MRKLQCLFFHEAYGGTDFQTNQDINISSLNPTSLGYEKQIE